MKAAADPPAREKVEVEVVAPMEAVARLGRAWVAAVAVVGTDSTSAADMGEDIRSIRRRKASSLNRAQSLGKIVDLAGRRLFGGTEPCADSETSVAKAAALGDPKHQLL